jgi:tetratricopeptide (TPR) repeat protein
VLSAQPIFSPQSKRQSLFPRVAEHARRAIALDPTDALARCSLSNTLIFAGRHNEAMAEADLAVGLDPNSAPAYVCQGFARAFGGRPREAVAPLETAMRLSPSDPFTPFCLHCLGRAYYYGGDYPVAVAQRHRVRCSSMPHRASAEPPCSGTTAGRSAATHIRKSQNKVESAHFYR